MADAVPKSAEPPEGDGRYGATPPPSAPEGGDAAALPHRQESDPASPPSQSGRSEPKPRLCERLRAAMSRHRGLLVSKCVAFHANCPWLFDRVWPMPTPLSPSRAKEKREKNESRKKEALEFLHSRFGHRTGAGGSVEGVKEEADAALEGALRLFEAEQGRRKSIEGRLTTTLGFVALASTITISVLGLRATSVVFTDNLSLGALAVTLMFYMVVQLVRAGLAAIEGLRRRTYLEPDHDSYLKPLAPIERQRHLASSYIECAFDYEAMNRIKVTWLAVAHRATKNFLGALVFLAFIASVGAWVQMCASPEVPLTPAPATGASAEPASTEPDTLACSSEARSEPTASLGVPAPAEPATRTEPAEIELTTVVEPDSTAPAASEEPAVVVEPTEASTAPAEPAEAERLEPAR